ncbi:MAG: formate dehydrogenase accessory sulfurtransferase FdhD, partial [Pseudomonadota bacterium]|nr:formate dehydrogenase accessory sulfurtransferase FdhD [Pseudomonadota bacterium]
LSTSRTPIDDELMAVGILFAGGIINSAAEISNIQLEPGNKNKGGNIVEDIMTITVPRAGSAPLQPSTAADIRQKLSRAEGLFSHLNEKFSFRKLLRFPQIMTAHQELYASSRAAHAVGLFNREGELLTCQEDASRTHALHKALGFCLQHELARGELVAVFSGRINIAIAWIIVRAGFQLVLSISAPTNTAVQIMNQACVTYIGSLRDEGGILYTPKSPLTIKG